MTAVLLEHVRAYATAVRSYLADLSAEQVDDLTDGLEADLAEACADPRGPVATGEIPMVDPAGLLADAAGTSMFDLTQRFGPAVEYAAELRSAAGLEPGQAPGHRRFRDGAASLWGRARAASGPVRSSAPWQAVGAFLVALAPLWWVLRGWVVFAVFLGLSDYLHGWESQHFVPRAPLTQVLLIAVVLGSVQVGRGLGRSRTWSRRTLGVVNVVAIVFVVPMLAGFDTTVHQRLAARGPFPVFVRERVAAPAPQNGVFVGGVQVSNLFMYDAAGNPLDQVQVFDDRGRPVRTTYDGGGTSWALPGVTEAWTFLPSQDADGRSTWNVYPLVGLPATQVSFGASAEPKPVAGATPRIPPRPFAKAPAVADPVAAALPAAP